MSDLVDWIAPARTALVIVDMQVDFASPEGVLGKAGVDMSVVEPALAAAQRLADAARAARTPVVFVGLQTRTAFDSQAWRLRMARRGGDPDVDIALCRAGEPGADFYGPIPLVDELVVPKTRYSGFFGTPLDAALKAKGVDTLVICGVTTDCCVDCTVRDAFHLDYHVFIAGDACASYDRDLHEGTLKALDLNFAIVTDSGAVATAWGDSHG